MPKEQQYTSCEVSCDPHAEHRRQSAVKHAEYAKAAGKSMEEVREVFSKVMEFDTKDLDSLPKDEAHQKYRMALIHARKASEAGKSPEEVHAVFQRIMKGSGTGACSHKK